VTLRLEDYLEAVFLDIETTGINPAYSDLTLIALYQEDHTGKKARLYVNDLHDAQRPCATSSEKRRNTATTPSPSAR